MSWEIILLKLEVDLMLLEVDEDALDEYVDSLIKVEYGSAR